MDPISVPAGTRLDVTYSFHDSPNPVSDGVIVLHHGICHTRDHFLPLIFELNRLGRHVAMIDQQSEHAGFFRNAIGAKSYREGMAAAVRKIEQDTGRPIAGYALHSMGALIGEEMQQRYPELRRPTVLLAPIPVGGAWPITWRMIKRHPLPFLKAVLTLDVHSLVKTPEQVRELFFDDETPQPIVDEATARLKHAPFWMYCQLILRRFLRPRIENDNRPKLLCFSKTDEIFHPKEYDKTRARFPDLEDCQIPGGHDFYIQYAETTAEQIVQFFKEHAEEGAGGDRATPQLKPFRQPKAIESGPGKRRN